MRCFICSLPETAKRENSTNSEENAAEAIVGPIHLGFPFDIRRVSMLRFTVKGRRITPTKCQQTHIAPQRLCERSYFVIFRYKVMRDHWSCFAASLLFQRVALRAASRCALSAPGS